MTSDRKRGERRIAGRYQLQEPIGKGGMGIVWRAHDELLDRTVAVKEVRYAAALGDEVQLLNRRTMREARAAARFEHPNAIIVHDVIEEDGRPWIVMQLVPSRSLGAVIKQDGPLPPKRVAEIGLAVLDALHRAHEAGVMHRDVKPENVLLADDGRVVLTDFGIATLETETQLTVTGLAGTPAFIAPERLKGLPARRESDLWSLGATLYTALEGRSPHERGMALATMHAVLTDPPDPAEQEGPLGEVIQGLLVKEPVQRLTYEETARLLRRAIARARMARTRVEPESDEDDMPTDPTLRAIRLPETGTRLAPAVEPDEPDATRRAPRDRSLGSPGEGALGSLREAPRDLAREDAWRSARQPEQREAFHAHDAESIDLPPAEPTVRSRGGDGRRFGPIAAAGAAVVLVAGVGGYLGLHSVSSTPPSPKKEHASLAPSTPPTKRGSPSTSPTTSPQTPSPTASADALPDGWKMYKDKQMGFSVALPKGWDEYNRNGNQVFFRGPGAASNAFLMIEEADKPGDDPYKDWKQQEKGADSRFGGYQLIGIKRVDYMKSAADWDFTWNTNTGKTHVRNRGFLTGNGRGYALYWHNLASRWKKDLHFFETFAATFKPAK
ncbi:serine/threonine-protein kinase [Nonomuraea sp. NPDC050536]|uniref:serine/threonine-protein kinase n=1 Tax=Nonomuraea sp. NPDC050536 TaxID=3364366 RepID=UPI0037CA8B74